MEFITTKAEYDEAKQKILQFELDYVAKFYGKVIYIDEKKERRIEYFQSLDELVKYCIQLTHYKIEHTSHIVTYREWDENYLPF